MNNQAKIGLAVAGGYLLGRSKKGKAALSLALFLGAGSKLPFRPGQMLAGGALSGQLGGLTDQLRGPLAAAGKKAAIAAVEARLGRVADNLQERTSRLTDRAGGSHNADEAEGAYDDEAEYDEDEQDDHDDEADDDEEPDEEPAEEPAEEETDEQDDDANESGEPDERPSRRAGKRSSGRSGTGARAGSRKSSESPGRSRSGGRGSRR